MQQVHSRDLTPNHTLRRLIQEWSVKNLSQELGIVERIPTPKQPADLLQVHHMLQDITDGYRRLENLQRLHCLARDSEKNRRCVLEAGAVPVLASMIAAATAADASSSHSCHHLDHVKLAAGPPAAGSTELDQIYKLEIMSEVVTGCVEEALATLALLPMDDEKTRKMLTGPTQLEQINWFLANDSRDSRVYAACLLANLVEQDVEFKSAMASQPLLLEGLVSLLKEEAATAAVSRSCNNNNNNNPGSAAAAARAGAIASLKCFAAICLARKHRVKAIDAGVAAALVDTLMLQVQPSSEEVQLENEETVTELAVCVLDLVCACAEGRAAVCDRVEAITALVKIVLRQSKLATEHALAALWTICRSTADAHIQLEAVRAGLFTKLLVLVQSDHGPRTKAIASHLLRLLQNTGRQNSLECLIFKPL